MPAISATFLSCGLAPRAAHLRLAQRGDQGGRLPAQRLAGVAHGPDVGPQVGGHRDPLLLDLGQPGLELLEAGRHRREQLLGRLEALLRRGVDRLPCRSATSADSSRNWSTIACRSGGDLLGASEGRVALGDGARPRRPRSAPRWCEPRPPPCARRPRRLGRWPAPPGRGPARARRGRGDSARPSQAPAPRPSTRARSKSSAGVMEASSTQTTDRTPDHTPGMSACIAYSAGYGPPRRRPCHDRGRGRRRRPRADRLPGAAPW